MTNRIKQLKELLAGRDDISKMIRSLDVTGINMAVERSYQNGYEDGKIVGYTEGRDDLSRETEREFGIMGC